jgi:predicted phage-related endonuclease
MKETKEIVFENTKKTAIERTDDMFEGLERVGLEASLPNKIVDIETLDHDEWLSYRRNGIGGSDAGVIMGVNHWSDTENLYRDKKGLNAPETIDYKKQAMFDMGHLAEDVIGRIVEGKMHFNVFKDNNMYQHSAYPWMLADCDLFAYDLEGCKVGIECKYINPDDLKMKWHSGVYGKDAKVGNLSYLVQCRHYMCVMNLDRWYLCVWGGNNADDIVIIRVDRDYEFERELVIAEDKAWHDIENDIVPEVTSKSDMAFEKIKNSYEFDAESKDYEQLSTDLAKKAEKYIELTDEISAYTSEIKSLKEQRTALQVDFLDAMKDKSPKGIIPIDDDTSYVITYLSAGLTSSFDWKALKDADPETLEYLSENGFFKQSKKAPTFKLIEKNNTYIK